MSVFTVLEKLAPHVEREVKLILKSKEEADALKSKLVKIQEGLQDAESRGVTDKNVKNWLKELEDVMYEMDDVLDKWETKNLEQQIQQSEYDQISDPCEKVRSLFTSLCLSFKHFFGRRGLTLEMKDLSGRLDKIMEEKDEYNFVPYSSDNAPSRIKKSETTSVVDKSKVFGREFDKDRVVELLLSQNGMQVISIGGVGGLGKTTLAQLVYNDPKVKGHFGNLTAWVSVANPFDASQVARAILESFDKSSSGNLENLGQRIKTLVSNQNFLLVLDDVLEVNHTEWDPLKNFLLGESGCKILVTTRDEIAARTMGTTSDNMRHLNLLSDKDCASILNTIALEGRREEEREKFDHIGLEIAKKCNGLPLAAQTIGRMLGESRFTVQEWEDVRQSPLWKYEDEMSDVFNPLRLGFMDLSPILKRCFLSCVLYPKGYEFDAAELSRIWMAQDYISSSATCDQVQSEGMKFLQKLIQRSFLQEVRRDESVEGGVICRMHDVMYEFAVYLLRTEYNFILDHTTPHIVTTDPRAPKFSAISVSRAHLPENFFKLLKRVRVMCLSDCDLEELCEGVGELIHLRYLNLSKNPLKQLPDALCDLYNLQTLDLQECGYDLSTLPHGIWKLINLRHLLTLGTNCSEFPRELEKLKGLWTLNEFRATSNTVGYLRDLNELRGYLKITVNGLNQAGEAEKANLRNKNHIQYLGLCFEEDVTSEVVEAMVPPPQLHSLYVEGEGNLKLPSWITTTTLANLKELRIYSFGDCSHLPSLGKLAMLEALEVTNVKFKSVTLEFLGSGGGGFPKLKKLEFINCGLWEEWEDLPGEEAVDDPVPMKIMPCLEELRILECHKLKALPLGLLHAAKSLQKLDMFECWALEPRYHKKFGAPDLDKLPRIPCIKMVSF